MKIDGGLREDLPVLDRFDRGRIGLSINKAVRAVDVTRF